ncbi:MAG: hypothetical protein FJW88_08290, partial [Actinobacteria bacterium]|nr:hypothetical protein [Actinomycetota bacterium]
MFRRIATTFSTGLLLMAGLVGISSSSAQPMLLPPVPRPAISVGDASIPEGNVGNRQVYFTVTLSDPQLTNTTVKYTAIPITGSATDFQVRTVPATLTVRAGLTKAFISVLVYPDTVADGDKSFAVTLSAPSSGVSLHRSTGIGTIIDDDPGSDLTVSVGDVAAVEGDTGTIPSATMVQFPVVLSGPAPDPITVGYLTRGNGTATPFTDYTPKTGLLNFAAGTFKKYVTINVARDVTQEPDETLGLTLYLVAGSATLGRAESVAVILPDDPVPTTTSLTSGPNPSTVGQYVPFTAAVSPSTATGSVEFYDGLTLLGTGTLVNGIATYQTGALLPEDHTITATYTGDTGHMHSSSDPITQTVLPAPRASTQIAAGSSHTCAILDNGTVKCWGYNAKGQLGLGNTDPRGDGPGEMGDNLPAVDLGTGRTATAITAGYQHTCVILDNGTVKCWGYNAFGQLGLGD